MAAAGRRPSIGDLQAVEEALKGVGGRRVAEKVALRCGEFDARDDEDAFGPARFDGRRDIADLVVVGDRQDRQTLLLGQPDDGGRRGCRIGHIVRRPVRMHVKIATEESRPAAQCRCPCFDHVDPTPSLQA